MTSRDKIQNIVDKNADAIFDRGGRPRQASKENYPHIMKPCVYKEFEKLEGQF